jgi:hypothetical protein
MGIETNQIQNTKVAKTSQADGKSGINADIGPYEAIVQGHKEGSRSGELIVSIPGWTGIQSNPESGPQSDQITVSYCSPFYGTTFAADTGLAPDTPQTSGQSYGMWMVPPDIGNKVLVIFTKAGKGYWIGCVYDSPSNHMVPGIARNVGGSSNTKVPPASDGVTQYFNSSSNLPVTEFNLNSSTAFSADGEENTPRYPHEVQALNYVMQGLDRDKIRGAISSSAAREGPSNVYGISTPGRKATADDQVKNNPDAVFLRKGGHTFVMDDGAAAGGNDPEGTDQLIRLRTSGGHQILMNDTEKVLYVGSASGAQWLEFSKNGAINIYGAGGFNLRTEGPMNFHSDSSITMQAVTIAMNTLPSLKGIGIPGISLNSSGTFSASAVISATIKSNATLSLSSLGIANLSAGGLLKLAGGGGASLSALGALKIGCSGALAIDGPTLMLNCASPVDSLPIIIPAIPTIPNIYPDAQWTGTGWAPVAKVLSSCSVVPTHEPWERVGPKGSNLLNAAVGLGGIAAQAAF